MKKLSGLIRSNKILVIPGAYDVFSAKIIEKSGFPAVYLTGYGTSASLLGLPDLGFLTLNELCGVAGNICSVIKIPLISDAESGFGNVLNVARTVREFEKAGVQAIHLEDQIVPKKHKPDGFPQVVGLQEHADKIRIAVRSRKSKDFLIIGRTDSLERHGVEEAVKRANAYQKAGADIIFVHGIKRKEDVRAIARHVKAIKLINYSAFTVSDQEYLPPLSELEELGYKIIILAIEPLLVSAGAMAHFLKQVRNETGIENLKQFFISQKKLEEYLEIRNFRYHENNFLPESGAL